MPPHSNPRCIVLRGVEAFQGRQGLTYVSGISTATTGARNICMVYLELPGGARAKAHLHRGIETAVYVIAGEAETWFGESLENHVIAHDGSYVYIAADTPHVVVNRTDLPCWAVVTHSAGDDQEGIVLLPELDARVP